MSLAKQDTIHPRVAAHRKGAFAVAAFEAMLMIRIPFKGQQINDINSLITSLAFIQRSCESHYEEITLLQDRLDPRRKNFGRRTKKQPPETKKN